MAAQLRPTRPRAELAAEEAAVALARVRRRCPGAVDESTSLRAALRSGVVLGRLAGALGLGDCAWRAVDERALGATTAAGSVARLRAFENVAAALALLRAEFESSTRRQCERMRPFQPLRPRFENSTRAIDSSKHQPNRRRCDRERAF